MRKETADDWAQKISRAKQVKEGWRSMFRIPACYAYFEGRQRPSHVSEEDWVTINMFFSTLVAELPALYSMDPYFYVKLRTSYSLNPMDVALFEKNGKVRQHFLNYLKVEQKLKQKARLAIFDSFFQFGVMKLHYSAERLKNPDAGQIILNDSETPMLDDAGAPLIEPEYVAVNESYCVSRIHPDDFLVDEDADPLEVSWKAQRLRLLLDDVRGDKKYRAVARKVLQATEIKDESDRDRERRKKGLLATDKDSKAPDVVVLWEIYDLKRKQWLVIADGCPEFLIAPESLPPGIDGDPFVELRQVLRDDSWYPLPPLSQLVDPQREYCESRSRMMRHRKRFNRKYTIYEGGFKDPEQAKVDVSTGDDGTVIASNHPGPTVFPIQDAPLDQQAMVEYTYLRQDFADLATGSNQRGSTAGVDSATEAGLIERRTQIREGDKVALVSDFLCEAARKLDQIVQANITRDQVVLVAGPGEEETWELIRTQDYDRINGEYEYSIVLGSTTPKLPEIERAQWLGFLTWLVNALTTAPDLISPSLVKKSAELHGLSPDDPIVAEVVAAAKNRVELIMNGQLPPPGGAQGSQPNVSNMDPEAVNGGMAFGINNIRGGEQ